MAVALRSEKRSGSAKALPDHFMPRIRRGFPVIRPGTARLHPKGTSSRFALRAPRRFAPHNDTSGGAAVHQRPPAVEWLCTRRSVTALQAVGFAARIRWRKANKFVIARALCARGNLGKALTYSPMAPQLSSHVLRDSHVASLLGMTILEPLRVRRCRSLHEPIRKKTGPQACADKTVI